MASYTDKIPTFNPYVKQRPVEAMLKVGMYKQQKYEENVTKIQKGIDSVAGLDVARPQDKEYLQSKLNQLGSSLSTVAAGDFSNFQLVNSVNGMTNQIAKDPKVLNAVASASKYRKDSERISKLKEEGKWSGANQLAYDKEVSQWYNGGQEDSYKANVIPYEDPMKETIAIVKTLSKDFTENDITLDYDANGNITGVRDVMTRQRIEGITPEKIQTALQAGLSNNAKRQIALDGQYKYNNVSSEQFIQDINNKYSRGIKNATEIRNKTLLAAQTTSNPNQKAALLNQVELMDQQLDNKTAEYNSISRGFLEGETDAAKAQLYTMDWMDNVSQSFSSKGQSQKQVVNPTFTTSMQRANLQLSQAKFRETLKQNEISNKIQKAKLAALQENANPFNPLPLPDNKTYTPETVIGKTEAKIESQYNSIAKEEEAFKNQYKLDDAAYTELINQYNKGGSGMTPSQKRQIEKILKLSEQAAITELSYERIKKKSSILNNEDLTKKYPQLAKEYNMSMQDAEGNTSVTRLDYADVLGKFDEYTEKFIYSQYISGGGSDKGFTVERYNDELAQQELSPSEYKLYELWRNKGRGQGPEYLKMYNELTNLAPKITKEIKATETAQTKYIADELQKNSVVFQEQGYPVKKQFLEGFKTNVLKNLSIIAQRQDGGLPNSNVTSEQLEKMIPQLDVAVVTTDGEGRFGLELTGKDKTKLSIPQLEPEVYNTFRSYFDPSPEVRQFNTSVLPVLLSTPRPIVNELDQNSFQQDLNKVVNSGEELTDAKLKELEIKNTVQRELNSNYYTTSTDGDFETTLDNAVYQKFNFPNVNKFGVSANIVTEGDPKSDDSRYRIQFNIYNPVDKKWRTNIESESSYDKAGIIKAMSSQKLNDETMYQLYYGTKKSVPKEFLNKLEEVSKTLNID